MSVEASCNRPPNRAMHPMAKNAFPDEFVVYGLACRAAITASRIAATASLLVRRTRDRSFDNPGKAKKETSKVNSRVCGRLPGFSRAILIAEFPT